MNSEPMDRQGTSIMGSKSVDRHGSSVGIRWRFLVCAYNVLEHAGGLADILYKGEPSLKHDILMNIFTSVSRARSYIWRTLYEFGFDVFW